MPCSWFIYCVQSYIWYICVYINHVFDPLFICCLYFLHSLMRCCSFSSSSCLVCSALDGHRNEWYTNFNLISKCIWCVLHRLSHWPFTMFKITLTKLQNIFFVNIYFILSEEVKFEVKFRDKWKQQKTPGVPSISGHALGHFCFEIVISPPIAAWSLGRCFDIVYPSEAHSDYYTTAHTHKHGWPCSQAGLFLARDQKGRLCAHS